MSCRVSALRLLFAGVVMCVYAPRTFAQFDELVARVPSTANSLVLVNVDKVMASPVGVKENWKATHEKSYAAGITFLPPDSKLTVLASQLDFDVMVPLWTTAVMMLDHDASLPMVQRMTGGVADQIGKYPAVALPGDSFLVQFAARVVAAMAPANRQAVGRWVRETDVPGNRLSPYLTEAYGYANEVGTPLIFALDLQDVVTAESVREALKASEKYASAPNVDSLVTLLSSVRGITLGITLQADKPFGKIKIDFGTPVTISPEEGKAILLHALAERGAMLDELEDWLPKVSGQMITLEGEFTASGMKRLSSLFDRPPSFKHGTAPGAADQQSTANSPKNVIQSSQQYFHRVNDLLSDLRKEKRKNSTYTTGSIAMWCDSYARKIDQLSVVGVDPELVEFASGTSSALRGAGFAIKSSNARKRVRQVNTPAQYDYYSYGATYGYTYRNDFFGAGNIPYGSYGVAAVPNVTAYQAARTAIGAEERVTGMNQARDILGKLEQGMGDMRRKLEQKYMVNF